MAKVVQNSPYHDALERVLAELESHSIPPCAVTDEAWRAVETRLYNLPRFYDELERADGLDALLMSHEIRRVEKALETVCGDEYFPLIPIRYFQNADEWQVAATLHCDKATVWRNRKRLLDALAIRLMGTEAWKTNIPPPTFDTDASRTLHGQFQPSSGSPKTAS